MAPVTGAEAMQRLRGEDKTQHKAFLVYSIAGEKRSVAAVHRALRWGGRRTENCLNKWRRTFEWERRIRETPDPDVEAFMLYDQLYLAQHGASAIVRLMEDIEPIVGLLAQVDRQALLAAEREAIARSRGQGRTGAAPDEREEGEDDDEEDGGEDEPGERPERPLVAAAPIVVAPNDRMPGRGGLREERVAIARAEQDGGDGADAPQLRARPEVTQRVMEALGLATLEPTPAQVVPAAPAGPTKEELAERQRERDLKLLDAALGYCAKALQEGKVPVTLGGIATLLKTKQLLLGRATANVAVAVSTVEPARTHTVRLQQVGGTERERLAAFREDLDDLATILDGIEAAQGRDDEIAAAVTTGGRARA
jgi:hypothetical protein